MGTLLMQLKAGLPDRLSGNENRDPTHDFHSLKDGLTHDFHPERHLYSRFSFPENRELLTIFTPCIFS